MPRAQLVPPTGIGEEEPLPPPAPTGDDPLRALVRSAVLAPSSHNTQPWLFRIGEDRVDVLADPGRWLSAADPDRRELHLSVGAALENLLLAAEHAGYRHEVTYFPEEASPEWIARVSLAPDPRPWRPSLFAAIPRRRTNRRPHRPEPVDPGLLADLASIAWDSGIRAWTSADAGHRRAVARLVARGDRIEFADPAFRRELGEWIGRGLLALPWTIARLAQVAVTRTDLGRRMARRDAALVEGAGALLVVVTRADDPVSRVRAGRAMERVWLLATQLGLALQPMSQPLQVPHLRRELAEAIGAGDGHPQQLFRIGYAEPEKRRARRRPLEEAILP